MQSIALAKGFLLQDWETLLLTFRPSGALASRVQAQGIPWMSLQPLDMRTNWFAPGLVESLRNFQPDAVLLMGREANCQGEILKKQFPGVRIIGTVRTGRKIPARYKRSLESCDLVICNSQWAAERLESLGDGVPRKIHVIHNGLVHDFKFDRKQQLQKQTRKQFGTRADTIVFLLCSAFRKGKNHAQLLQILEELKGDWELWLAGSGKEKKTFFQKLQNTEFKDRVKDAGQILELDGLYAGADVGILPSLEESMSNFLIECQSWGLPVVAYDCAGNTETFIDGESGKLVPQGDGEAFGKELAGLIENHLLRERMSAAAISSARPKFNFQDRLDDYVRLIKSLVG